MREIHCPQMAPSFNLKTHGIEIWFYDLSALKTLLSLKHLKNFILNQKVFLYNMYLWPKHNSHSDRWEINKSLIISYNELKTSSTALGCPSCV